MRRIGSHEIWIGNVADGANFRSIANAAIVALVDLAANEPPQTPPRDLIYCRFPIVDGADTSDVAGGRDDGLCLAIQCVAGLVRASLPTLVFCSAGMSRSLCVTAAALSLTTGQSFEGWLTPSP
jgi:protein-tyrosine phosphatase